MLPSYPSEDLARHEEGFLNSADHLRLFWQRYTPANPRATVLVLHGGGDHCGRYPAVTDALVRAGLQVALVDLRGHGQSDGRRWHVDSFQDNVADFDAFVAKLSQDGVARDRLFVLGHSHGALVAAVWGLTRGRLSASAPGTLQVVVLPWADVTVDGRGAGTTPIPAIPLPPGPHTVVLRNAELGASRTLPVVIKPGKPTLLRVDLRRAE